MSQQPPAWAVLIVCMTVALNLPARAVGQELVSAAAPPSEDLGVDLLNDGAQPAVRNAEVRDILMREPARLHKDLTRGWADPAGEDVGAGQGGPLPTERLKRVTQRMQRAESALAARDVSGRASSTQQEVVSELDAMLARLQKECEKCGGQCNKPGPPQNKPPQPGSKPGSTPGESSVAAATSATATAERAAIGNLVNDLWGRLPERQRERLLQPLSEEFLPEYAVDIEEYFRVLASLDADAAETKP